MSCNPRTMLKIAAALAAILTIAYVALPAAQAMVLAAAPILLALACPLAMLVMAFAMKRQAADASNPAPKRDEVPGATESRDAAAGKA
jgi:hypothetical protein